MKKILMLMLGLAVGTASFANPTTPQATTQTRVVMTADHKIKLFVQPLQAKGQLAIVDATGQPVYNSAVWLQKGLSRQFDFSSLGAGTYQLTLKVGNETVVKKFVLQANPNESFVVQES
ncbi:T9SS type A sorting domain-containing protein [Spirosoma sp. KNUC1025]|uniref:T9SS type A sorting domain-containing protein n=1 Tax=Spirosoma sp. KNUC1025 TaxID=2894082 RepID=UPI00386C2431|nr:T9SS type A sorting domain-containing protein [Spirosoma sp. KNUC1025]